MRLIYCIVTVAVCVLSGCEQAPRSTVFVDLDSMREFVLGPVDTLPQIVYNNEFKSINDRCPVRDRRLSLKSAPLMVNDKPIAFC